MPCIFGINEDIKGDCAFTPFSLIHLLSGSYLSILLKYLKLNDVTNFLISNLIHFIYELKDYYIMYHTDKGKPGTPFNNSFINSVGDQLSFAIGSMIVITRNQNISKEQLVTLTLIFTIISIVFWTIAWGYFALG